MRIEYDIKLGFKDVMIRPKRSTLKSRSQVKLEREFTFLHSKTPWKGVPVMAANMDTVGTFEMAKVLAKNGLFTAIHKHYSVADWNIFIVNAPEGIENNIAISTGTGAKDSEKLAAIFEHNPQLKFICIDVANGYSEHFVNFLKKTRKQHPDKVIIAGNVVTGE
ncbi:MAG: IMP dehydrogenase, partial [Leeuwenhoekiella sp.]